jgi:zona occludens toxin
VALITQDVMDISRSVRAVIEETYQMTKLTAIGSAKRYRIDVFQGGRTTRKPLRSLQPAYEARYFSFYSSHSQKKEGDADAKEENIDGRGNILKGALFKVILPIGFLVAGFSVYMVYKFFNPTPKEATKVASTKAATSVPGAAAPAASAVPTRVEAVAEWRILGHLNTPSGQRFLLGSSTGGTRWVVNPPNVKLTSQTAELILPNGDAVVNWSSRPVASMVPGMPR